MTSETKVLSDDGIRTKLDQKARRKKLLTAILPFAGLAFLLVIFAFTTNGKFYDAGNIENLVNQCFVLTIIAVGAAFIYAAGMMDVSIGAVLALAELVMAMILRANYEQVAVAVAAGIAVAVICNSITALIHLILRVPVFIVSLCMMNICTGIVRLAVEEADVYIEYSNLTYINSVWIKVIVLAVVIALGILIFNYTRLGKDLKALGGNATAAQQSGVNRFKSLWLSFVILGACIGVAAFFALVRAGFVNGSSGLGVQFNIMVAIVLGGFPLMGGANAKVWGPIIGAVMVTVLTNGLILMGLMPEWGTFAKGVLFLLIVALTYEKSKGKLVQ